MSMKTAPTTMYETVNCNARPLPVSRVPNQRALPAAGAMPGPRISRHLQDSCEGAAHRGVGETRWHCSANHRSKSGVTLMEGTARCPLQSYLTCSHSQPVAGGPDVFDSLRPAQAQLP